MDLKFAVRSLAKNPGFTFLAVAVMALGIGANSAVFSVVNAVLLRPLAYHDPDRIVTLRNFWKQTASVSPYVAGPDYHDWHDQSTGFDAMAYYSAGPTAVILGNASEYAQVAQVTTEFFEVFGARPVIGRMFSAQEVQPGSSGAALISANYWRNHFGGDSNAIGRSLRIYGKSLTVVGVMEEGFDFPKNILDFQIQILFPKRININS